MKLKNNYFILRHGHSLRNVKGIASCWPEKTPLPLTEKGVEEAKKSAQEAKKNKINLIFCSDLLRTKQTARLIGKELAIRPKTDKRLREVNVGIFNGRPVNEIGQFWNSKKDLSPLEYYKKRFEKPLPKGETYVGVEKRLFSFIRETEKKHKGKNILLVSHARPLTLLEKVINGYDLKKLTKIIIGKKEIKTGEMKKLKN